MSYGIKSVGDAFSEYEIYILFHMTSPGVLDT